MTPVASGSGRFAAGADPTGRAAISVRDVTRTFGETVALDRVSLTIGAGHVHALVGPNGAGKTTLLRVASGLAQPTAGDVFLHLPDGSTARAGFDQRQHIGMVTSGTRSFYLRLSGLENLLFFARLHGLRRRDARARAHELMEQVGLAGAVDRRVGQYSQGMSKRLSVARALLGDPEILLVDEATHDLDPAGAQVVRDLVGASASAGAAVLWATQRLEEIRGFADGVTLLDRGRVAFSGSVEDLVDVSVGHAYVVRVRDGDRGADQLQVDMAQALGDLGSIAPVRGGGAEHFLLTLADDAVLGTALGVMGAAGVDILACREERSEIERAFLVLTGGQDRP